MSQFKYPSGLAVDSNSDVYITETGGNIIRLIRSTGYTLSVNKYSMNKLLQIVGTVLTVGGMYSVYGYTDGYALSATLHTADFITLSPSGNLFLTENHNIRVFNTKGCYVI